jgi:hypothetical protein
MPWTQQTCPPVQSSGPLHANATLAHAFKVVQAPTLEAFGFAGMQHTWPLPQAQPDAPGQGTVSGSGVRHVLLAQSVREDDLLSSLLQAQTATAAAIHAATRLRGGCGAGRNKPIMRSWYDWHFETSNEK